jgi:large subunit ribosomal protein L23
MLKAEMYDIIRRPIVTEKSAMLGEQRKYVFEVMPSANKDLVRKAIQGIFGVTVTKVNILNVKGTSRRFKGIMGRTSDMKKAIVTLAENQEIDLTGGVK